MIEIDQQCGVVTTEMLPIQSVPVERRHASELSNRAFLEDYVAKNRPVVVEDAVCAWPCATLLDS